MLSSLLKNLTRLPSSKLWEVDSCLRNIDVILTTKECLVRFTTSCVINIRKAVVTPVQSAVDIKRTVRTIYISRLLDYVRDFEDQLILFRTSFPTLKGDVVSGLITEIRAGRCPVQKAINLNQLCQGTTK